MILFARLVRVGPHRHPVALMYLLSAVALGHAQNASPHPSSAESSRRSAQPVEPATLVYVVRIGDFKRARQMLAKDADFSVREPDGMTALHWAAVHQDSDLVERLLQAGAAPQKVNHYGVSPLSIACRNGDQRTVAHLLNSGADANQALPDGETPLMTAARTGTRGPVEALIAAGATVNDRDNAGQTAIMWAAAEGHLEAVDALINADADYRRPLKSGFTPLFFAAREGKTRVVLRLLAAGLDVNDVMNPEKSSRNGPAKGTSLLAMAIENGHFELASELLDTGADPNESRVGYAPLHALTWVRKPIRGDGDPPPIGSGGMTSIQLVRKLISAGAEVNHRHGKKNSSKGRLNRTDATAFLLACETGDVPLMRVLLERGADPTLTNADNCTPLLAAAGVGILSNGDDTAGTEENAIQAVSLLLELGADIDAVDNHGNTAMHGAAFKSWTKLIAFLVTKGANVNRWDQKNRFGWTPLMIAQGKRPGNFRPSAETILAVKQALAKSNPE